MLFFHLLVAFAGWMNNFASDYPGVCHAPGEPDEKLPGPVRKRLEEYGKK